MKSASHRLRRGVSGRRPRLCANQYYQLMLTLVLVWAIMGVSWNMFSGYSGLVSFGHASFFGLGAYTVTLLLVKLDVTPWIGMPVGMLVGALAGVVIGYPTFRLRGVYFALAMLAYPLALLYIFEWLGYQEVSLPMKRESPAAYMQFSDHRAYVLIALALLVAALLRLAEHRALALRPVARRDQAERTGRGGRRHRRAALEAEGDHGVGRDRGRGRRLLRRGAARRHAGRPCSACSPRRRR